MRTFLKSTFKFLSRSLIVTLLFLCLFSNTTYSASSIQFIKANNTENTLRVSVSDTYAITWQAQEFAGCALIREQTGPDMVLQWSGGSGSSFSGRLVESDNDPGDTYPYTLTCYPEVILKDPVTSGTIQTFNSANPYFGNGYGLPTGQGTSVTKTVTVTVVDATVCPTDLGQEAQEKCEQVCENYPNEAVCRSCKADPNNPQCKDACLEPDVLQCRQNQENANAGTVGQESGTKCFPGILGGGGFEVKGCIIEILDATVVAIAASFLQLCAYIFEIAIQISIVQFSTLVTSTSGGDWLTAIWSTIRDILNIGVIFVLLYAAINVIVGRGGEIKKIISGVILFGVLTNFSLFFTKAALDLTNVIALEFYQQMRTLPLSETDFSGGLGSTIVSVSGLTNFYNPDIVGSGENAGTSDALDGRNPVKDSILYRFAMMVVFIAIGFIFLQAAGMFIARTISVLLLLIFSPLMFAGAVFSPLQKWIEQWHKEFLGQITVAPIFMILLYVILVIMKSFVEAVNTTLEKNPGDMFSFLSVVLLTSALIVAGFSAALNKAKSFSGSIGGKGAQWGNKLGGMAFGGAGRLALGGAASGLRSAANFAGAKKLSTWAENSNSLGGSVARALRVDKLKDATFDVRNSKLGAKLGTGVSAALNAAGVDTSSIKLGEGSKTTLATQKTIAEKADKFKNDFQVRADARGERLVEKSLQDITDKENKAGIKTDNEVFDFEIKHRDADGNILTTSRGLETDEEWAKEVKKVNQKNKAYIDSQKIKHLNNAPALAISTYGKNFASRRGTVAEYRARQKHAKQFKDSPETKLKEYTEKLKEYESIHGVTAAEIDGFNDEERIALWGNLAQEAEKEIKSITLVGDPTLDLPNLKKKREFGLLLSTAKNARKQIEELNKKIADSKDKKDDKKEDKEKK